MVGLGPIDCYTCYELSMSHAIIAKMLKIKVCLPLQKPGEKATKRNMEQGEDPDPNLTTEIKGYNLPKQTTRIEKAKR